MYAEKVIERLNHINWNNMGENGHEKDRELGVEFLRKMAAFCNDNHIIPSLPFMTDLSSFFADCPIDDKLLNKCNEDVRNMIQNPSLSTSVVIYYIKSARLSDQDITYLDCMNVYEPLIH